MQLDYIEINNLKLSMIIGVYDHEKIEPQPIKMDIKLYPQLQPYCLREDSLKLYGVDYQQAVIIIEHLANLSTCELLETFAEQCCATLLAKLPIQKIQFNIYKTAIIPQTDKVGICITRCAI